MAETNFYSYMYANAGTISFDEMTEIVELADPASVQRAFEAYMDDNTPPYDIKDSLLEEKFYLSDGEGDDGTDTYVRYDMSIPGVLENVDAESLKNYFDDFLERIGCNNDSGNVTESAVDIVDNERGGVDVNIYMAFGGKQISEGSKE